MILDYSKLKNIIKGSSVPKPISVEKYLK